MTETSGEMHGHCACPLCHKRRGHLITRTTFPGSYTILGFSFATAKTRRKGLIQAAGAGLGGPLFVCGGKLGNLCLGKKINIYFCVPQKSHAFEGNWVIQMLYLLVDSPIKEIRG